MISSRPLRSIRAGGGPWRSGNRFHLLAASEQYFERMLQAIGAAREYVLMEMYLVESGELAGHFVAALMAAAGRNVQVRVLLDGFGSLGFSTGDRSRLAGAGVQLQFYNALRWRKRLHNFLRDHRKLLLIDGRVAFVGGAGITDEFAGVGGKGPAWRDQMLEISGPVVADWEYAFSRTWSRASGEQPAAMPRRRGFWPNRRVATDRAPARDRDGAVKPGTFHPGADGRVALSEAAARSSLATDVVRRIERAGQRAWIMSAYFVPSRRFRKALRRTARRGVDVRLLVPGPRTDHPWVRDAARRFYGKLLRSGVRIFEYQPRVLHGKLILCDDWVSVGSSNLDRWSFKWNLEANQEVRDARFAADVAEIFENDCRESAELNRRHWPRRAWLHRVREWIAGAVDRWLGRWRRPRV